MWEKHHQLLPDLLRRLTPRQFAAAFCVARRGDGPDRVKAVRDLNDERGRRGLRPTIPSWL